MSFDKISAGISAAVQAAGGMAEYRQFLSELGDRNVGDISNLPQMAANWAARRNTSSAVAPIRTGNGMGSGDEPLRQGLLNGLKNYG